MNNERTQRALDLTTAVLKEFEGLYSVWEYRRRILAFLEYNLENEVLFIRTFITQCPKNYQVWHHRQAVVGKMSLSADQLTAELSDLNKALVKEPKNYHAWQYRQWLTRQYSVLDINTWNDELTDVNTMLLKDPFNNSAWHYKFQLCSSAPDRLDWEGEVNFLWRCWEMSKSCGFSNLALRRYSQEIATMLPPSSAHLFSRFLVEIE